MHSEHVLLPLRSDAAMPASFFADPLLQVADLCYVDSDSSEMANSLLLFANEVSGDCGAEFPLQQEAPVNARSSTSSNSEETEEYQQRSVIDERKKRRMLSNRESARRSRMRKQKHLDELRAQIFQMTAEKRQILGEFDTLTQKYKHVLEENQLLKSQTVNLSQQLQHLQQLIAASRTSFQLSHGMESSRRNLTDDERNVTVEKASEILLNATAKGIALSDILISC